MLLVVCVIICMFPWLPREWWRGWVSKVLATEKNISFLYKKLSLDLLPSCVGENIRNSVMLLWEQGGIGNWIFFCRPLLWSDHSNKLHDESSHIMSQPRKYITTPWYSDPNSRYHSQNVLFPKMKTPGFKIQFLLNSAYQNSSWQNC